MALGTPVVSTTVAGIPEMIDDGRSGVLVGQRDPQALADALERLLSSADLRARLAAGALDVMRERFSIRRNVAELAGRFAASASAATTVAA
jgi:colanic acid/amylovoran biosynthesis glycosyltransferase